MTKRERNKLITVLVNRGELEPIAAMMLASPDLNSDDTEYRDSYLDKERARLAELPELREARYAVPVDRFPPVPLPRP